MINLNTLLEIQNSAVHITDELLVTWAIQINVIIVVFFVSLPRLTGRIAFQLLK
jgi:hypothetical protein